MEKTEPMTEKDLDNLTRLFDEKFKNVGDKLLNLEKGFDRVDRNLENFKNDSLSKINEIANRDSTIRKDIESLTGSYTRLFVQINGKDGDGGIITRQNTQEKRVDRIYIIGGVVTGIIVFLGPVFNAIIFKILGLA